MLSDCPQVQGNSVVQREQHEYNTKKKHQKPQSIHKYLYRALAYSEHCQIFQVECFAKIVNSFYLLTVSTKRSTLDMWQGSEYAFDCL